MPDDAPLTDRCPLADVATAAVVAGLHFRTVFPRLALRLGVALPVMSAVGAGDEAGEQVGRSPPVTAVVVPVTKSEEHARADDSNILLKAQHGGFSGSQSAALPAWFEAPSCNFCLAPAGQECACEECPGSYNIDVKTRSGPMASSHPETEDISRVRLQRS